MSRENVEIVQRMWAAWHASSMTEWFEFFDADVVWHTREDEPDAGVYRGHRGIEQLMEFWTENFQDLRVEAEEFVDAGDHVVVPGVLHGRGKASGAPVDLPYTFVCALNDGTIIEVREYLSKSEALQALGVPDSV